MDLGNDPSNGKEATMCANHGWFRRQVRFLRQQFLQDDDLPFANILSEQLVAKALAAIDACWLDRIYSPLVTLWVFLSQVLNADPSCRAAVARLIAHRVARGESRVPPKLARTAKHENVCQKDSSRSFG
jgi:hypothetical protein